MVKMKTELHEEFELREDVEWKRWFWRGMVYAWIFSAAVAVGLIRFGAYLAERIYE